MDIRETPTAFHRRFRLMRQGERREIRRLPPDPQSQTPREVWNHRQVTKNQEFCMEKERYL